MSEYREQLDADRAKGLEQRHRFRLEMAVRREVAEEIAQAIEARAQDGSWNMGGQVCLQVAAKLAREIGARDAR